MKKIYQTATRIEAEIVKGKLEAHGIEALIRADDEGGINPSLQLTLGCHVYVFEEDVEAALRLLK